MRADRDRVIFFGQDNTVIADVEVPNFQGAGLIGAADNDIIRFAIPDARVIGGVVHADCGIATGFRSPVIEVLTCGAVVVRASIDRFIGRGCGIRMGATVDNIISGATNDRVITFAALDGVVACATLDAVVVIGDLLAVTINIAEVHIVGTIGAVHNIDLRCAIYHRGGKMPR